MANDLKTRADRTAALTDLLYVLNTGGVVEGKVLVSQLLSLSDKEINTASNSGVGAQLALAKDGFDLPFRTLVSSDGTVLFTPSATEMNLKALRVGLYRNIWIDAAAMVDRDTDGALPGTSETAGAQVMNDYLEFQNGVDRFVQFKMMMPDEWDKNPFKMKFYWSAADVAGAGDVIWSISSNALADGHSIDAQIGTPVDTVDTFLGISSLHITDASALVTVFNNPADEYLTYFEVARVGTNVLDTYTQPVRLLGVAIQYKERNTEPVIW